MRGTEDDGGAGEGSNGRAHRAASGGEIKPAGGRCLWSEVNDTGISGDLHEREAWANHKQCCKKQQVVTGLGGGDKEKRTDGRNRESGNDCTFEGCGQADAAKNPWPRE